MGGFVTVEPSHDKFETIVTAYRPVNTGFRFSMNAVRRLADEVFVHLHRLSLRFHLERRTGAVTKVIERGTKSIDTMLYFLLFNIAPTILHALGLPVGRDMDGHVLQQVFEPAIATRPVAYVDTWDTPASGADRETPLPPEVDRKMLEHMRSLGYIGQ